MFQLLIHPARACIVLLSLAALCRGELEALKAAEISREIRQQFRISGMNWVSPKMLREVGGTCVTGLGEAADEWLAGSHIPGATLGACVMCKRMGNSLTPHGHSGPGPAMPMQVVDLKTNTKPIMYMFTLRS